LVTGWLYLEKAVLMIYLCGKDAVTPDLQHTLPEIRWILPKHRLLIIYLTAESMHECFQSLGSIPRAATPVFSGNADATGSGSAGANGKTPKKVGKFERLRLTSGGHENGLHVSHSHSDLDVYGVAQPTVSGSRGAAGRCPPC